MSDYLPKFLPGDVVTITASATITGGQLVTTAGAVAGATALNVAGVAGHDAVSGQTLTVYRIGIHRLVAGTGGLTAGQPVKAGASGTAVLWVSGTDLAGSLLGRAWSTAVATASADVALFGV
jgi:hypothetical protein